MRSNPTISNNPPKNSQPGQVIRYQPNANQIPPQVANDGWMNIPLPLNCPNGLECLSKTSQLLVKQQIELLEAISRYETKNKYLVNNSDGQQMFFTVESSNCCARNCCGPFRPFEMKILDNYGHEVIHLSRPLAVGNCFCLCFNLQSIEVFSPPGFLVGTVEQDWSILRPIFTIRNAANEGVFNIEGPVCTCSRFGNDVKFKVLSKNKTTEVGRISKQWSGFVRESFTDADVFGITFPIDLDVRMKAVMLGACFLIDFMFFEN